MYRIDYYNYPLFDDQLQEIYPVTTAKLSLDVNSAGKLTMTIPAEHPHIDQLAKLKLGVKVVKDGKVIYKGRIIKDEKDFYNNRSITCESKLACLNDTIYRSYDFAGDPADYFTDLIDNHNSMVEDEKKFIVGDITVTDPNDYIARSSIDNNITWDLIKKLVDSLGGYIVIRHESNGDYIDWVDDFDYSNTQEVAFAENLLDLTEEISAEETYTACIPLGAKIEISNYAESSELEEDDWKEDTYYTKSGESYILIASESAFLTALTNGTTIYVIESVETLQDRVTVESVNDGKDYIYNESKVEEYGWKFAPPAETIWDDVTRPENLLTKATEFLNNSGIMLKNTLELSAIDLSYADADIDSFEWCEHVKVNSVPHSLQKTYLLSKIDIDMLHPENSKITLGDTKYTLYDGFKGQDQIVDKVTERVEQIEADYTTDDKVMSEISERASQILQTAEEIVLGTLSGYVTSSDLETYKQQIENLLTVTEEGFSFEFSQIENKITELGSEIIEKNQFIRLVEGNIIIGKIDNPIQAKFTNDSLEFTYNDQVVARFTNEVLEVRNIRTDNQVGFGNNWAIRPGQYIESVEGYNLDLMWTGG